MVLDLMNNLKLILFNNIILNILILNNVIITPLFLIIIYAYLINKLYNNKFMIGLV